MAEKEISLLQQQLAGLDIPGFDLDAWKQHTLIFLERIFGKNSTKLKLVSNLHYDYSSWSLRDTAATGKTKDKDPVKMQAREIIKATILELETLGLPNAKKEEGKIWELLQDELTGKQIKEIEAIINSGNKDKTEEINTILSGIPPENRTTIIAKLLLN